MNLRAFQIFDAKFPEFVLRKFGTVQKKSKHRFQQKSEEIKLYKICVSGGYLV